MCPNEIFINAVTPMAKAIHNLHNMGPRWRSGKSYTIIEVIGTAGIEKKNKEVGRYGRREKSHIAYWSLGHMLLQRSPTISWWVNIDNIITFLSAVYEYSFFFFWLQPERLFSDIGGTVGLYIGFSLITVCEFAMVAIHLIRYCCRKYVSGENLANDEENQANDGYGQQ